MARSKKLRSLTKFSGTEQEITDLTQKIVELLPPNSGAIVFLASRMVSAIPFQESQLQEPVPQHLVAALASVLIHHDDNADLLQQLMDRAQLTLRQDVN